MGSREHFHRLEFRRLGPVQAAVCRLENAQRRASARGAYRIGIGLRGVSQKPSLARIAEVDGARRLPLDDLRQRHPLPVAASVRGVEKGNASLADDYAVVALKQHLLGSAPIPLKLLLPVSHASRAFDDDRWPGRT